MHLPTRNDIDALAHRDPCVHQALALYYLKEVTYEQALLLMVVTLTAALETSDAAFRDHLERTRPQARILSDSHIAMPA